MVQGRTVILISHRFSTVRAADRIVVPARRTPESALHLDTVFPGSTVLELQRKGRLLLLPGISDNGSGLVALLWSLRAAKESGLRFRRPVVAVGDVGEEAHGNLRGIRHLFQAPPWVGRECDFIAVDGAGVQRITHQALGSRRLRVRMMGPGGHSWADFGRPNPVHALATAIHFFAATGAGRRSGTSFNVGVIRGGISVNAIPTEAFMEVDLRSSNPSNLDALDGQLKRAVGEAARLDRGHHPEEDPEHQPDEAGSKGQRKRRRQAVADLIQHVDPLRIGDDSAV